MSSKEFNLYIVCGLSGTGKTTLAKAVAQRAGGVQLRSDVIRKRMFPKPIYSSEETDRVYRAMFEEAEDLLTREDVVLDATFSKEKHRRLAKEIAARLGVGLYIIQTVSDESKIRHRLGNRAGDVSDATFAVYQKQKKDFEQITEHHRTIDTTNLSMKDLSELAEGIVSRPRP